MSQCCSREHVSKPILGLKVWPELSPLKGLINPSISFSSKLEATFAF